MTLESPVEAALVDRALIAAVVAKQDRPDLLEMVAVQAIPEHQEILATQVDLPSKRVNKLLPRHAIHVQQDLLDLPEALALPVMPVLMVNLDHLEETRSLDQLDRKGRPDRPDQMDSLVNPADLEIPLHLNLLPQALLARQARMALLDLPDLQGSPDNPEDQASLVLRALQEVPDYQGMMASQAVQAMPDLQEVLVRRVSARNTVPSMVECSSRTEHADVKLQPAEQAISNLLHPDERRIRLLLENPEKTAICSLFCNNLAALALLSGVRRVIAPPSFSW